MRYHPATFKRLKPQEKRFEAFLFLTKHLLDNLCMDTKTEELCSCTMTEIMEMDALELQQRNTV